MNASKLMDLSKLIGVLKHLPRTGWVQTGVAVPESVAGHIYRMSLFAFCLDKNTLDRDRCIKMALVHDLAESIVGDITPFCGVSDEEKYKREKKAMIHIASLVPTEVGSEFINLWEEFEERKTPEAKAVRDLDKFDLIAQAFEYEAESSQPGKLQEFFDSTPNSIFTNPTVHAWAQKVAENRIRLMEAKKSVPVAQDKQ